MRKCKDCYWYTRQFHSCEYEEGETFHVRADDECHITYTNAYEPKDETKGEKKE